MQGGRDDDGATLESLEPAPGRELSGRKRGLNENNADSLVPQACVHSNACSVTRRTGQKTDLDSRFHDSVSLKSVTYFL